jgi:glycosyltransferase involved in cell wall biosynthesis
MPVRNAKHTLARAINSIQEQTFKNWELIIVEDGSTDSTPELIKQFAIRDKRIQLKINLCPGIANALNHGIEQAKGNYIARMDADDQSHPDRLQLQFSFLNENEAIGLVSSKVNFMGNRVLHQGYAAYVDWTNRLLKWDDIRANRFVESPFAHPSVMFRKTLAKSSSGPYLSGDFPEDYELWLRWIEKGVRMAKLDSTLLNWYDPPERLSRNDPRYEPDAFYKIKAKYLARWMVKESHNLRPIWIWGAGRITRKRARLLNDNGLEFAGYIDIDPKKVGTRVQAIPVILPHQLDIETKPFVISYVGNRGARADIKSDLIKKGMVEEQDFILAA